MCVSVLDMGVLRIPTEGMAGEGVSPSLSAQRAWQRGVVWGVVRARDAPQRSGSDRANGQRAGLPGGEMRCDARV